MELASINFFSYQLGNSGRWRMNPETWGEHSCIPVNVFYAQRHSSTWLLRKKADFLGKFILPREVQGHPSLSHSVLISPALLALEGEMTWTLGLQKSSRFGFSGWLIWQFLGITRNFSSAFCGVGFRLLQGVLSVFFACKNMIHFHLLFFITKSLWKDFSLICCHKQPLNSIALDLWGLMIRWKIYEMWRSGMLWSQYQCYNYKLLSVKLALCDNSALVVSDGELRFSDHCCENQLYRRAA